MLFFTRQLFYDIFEGWNISFEESLSFRVVLEPNTLLFKEEIGKAKVKAKEIKDTCHMLIYFEHPLRISLSSSAV